MIEEAVWNRVTEELNIDCYPLVLPPSATLPACTYRRISTVREYTHDGDSLLERIRFQFDLWAETYAEVRQQAETLRGAWSGYSGQVYEDPDIYISAAFILGELDLYEPEPAMYHASMDVSMWVRTVE
jgi:hypothetical protein